MTSEKGLVPQLTSSKDVMSIEKLGKTKPPLPSRQNSANRVGSNAKSGDTKTPLPSRTNTANNAITPKYKSGPQRSLSKGSKMEDYKWLLEDSADHELPRIPV